MLARGRCCTYIFSVIVDDALGLAGDRVASEVDEESYLFARQTQVRQQLPREHRLQPRDRLDLDDDEIFYDEVGTEGFIERYACIYELDCLLSTTVQAAELQRTRQQCLVY